MGVDGLWQLIEPVARPIALETMGNKRLAIDSSIWLYQFQHATRDRDGRTLDNAHIMGFVSRIKKLLHYGIKPVFVFDGGAPQIKRIALAKRQKRKREGEEDTRTTASRLLTAKLRAAAVAEARGRAVDATAAGPKGKGKAKQDETGDWIGDDAVYFDDLGPGNLAPVMHAAPRRGRGEAEPDDNDAEYRPRATSSPQRARQSEPPAEPPPKKKKYVPRDDYALPKLDGPMHAKASLHDPRMATEEELRDLLDVMRPDDFDIDSAEFKALPYEQQYAIVQDLKHHSRSHNWRRVEALRDMPTSLDISKAQVLGLKQRGHIMRRAFEVAQQGGEEIKTSKRAESLRIAGERNRTYTLVRNDPKKGGGYVLARPGMIEGVAGIGTAAEPHNLAGSTTDGSTTEGSDVFEEVAVPRRPIVLPHVDEERRERQQRALLQRYAVEKPAKPTDPYLDFAPPDRRDAQPLFLDGVDETVMAAAGGDEGLLRDILAHVGRDDAERARSASQPVASTSAPLSRRPSGYRSDDSLEYADDDDGAAARPSEPPPEPSSSDEASFDEVAIPTPMSRNVSQQAPPPAQPDPVPSPSSSDDMSVEEVAAPQPAYKPTAPPARPIPAPAATEPPVTVSRARPPAPPQSATSPEVVSIHEDGDEAVENTPDEHAINPRLLMKTRLARPATREAPPRALPGQPIFDRQRPIAPMPRRRSPTPPPRRESPPPPGEGVVRRDHVSPPPQPPRHREPPLIAVPISEKMVDALEPGRTLRDQVLAGDADAPMEDLDKGLLQQSAADAVARTVGDPSPAPQPLPRALSPDPEPSPPPPPSVLRNAAAAPGSENDADAISDWSRSPTPPPRLIQEPSPVQTRTLPPNRAAPPPARRSESRDVDLDAEADAAAAEVAKMQAQSRRAQQMATDVTQQMAKEVQVMLGHFGIPYVVAPMEAEAQCAELVTRRLVDGIVTDDSDVFLFGGTRVYRHMFTANKYVECYNTADIERELLLDRDKLISLAYLLGSDYSDGIKGVGGVIAMQLLAEFPGPDCVKDFGAWWRRVQYGKDTADESATPFRKSFKKRQKDLVLEEAWPDPRVKDAYLHPNVDASDERFTWGSVDLPGLQLFLKDSLGWGADKVNSTISPVIKVMDDRKKGVANMQGSLDNFFDASGGTGVFQGAAKYKSAKLADVLRTFRRQRAEAAGEAPPSESEEEARPKKPRKPRAKKATKRKKTVSPSLESSAGEEEPEVVAPKKRSKPRAKPKPSRAVIQSEDEVQEPSRPSPVSSHAPSRSPEVFARPSLSPSLSMTRPSLSPALSTRQPPPPLVRRPSSQDSVRPPPVAPMLARTPSAQADAAVAHLPPPRKRSGIGPPTGSTSTSSGSKTKPAKPKKRKLGTSRTAAEKRRHRVASDDSGWEE